MDVLLKDGSDGVPRETRVHDCTMITVTADLTWSGPEAREVDPTQGWKKKKSCCGCIIWRTRQDREVMIANRCL